MSTTSDRDFSRWMPSNYQHRPNKRLSEILKCLRDGDDGGHAYTQRVIMASHIHLSLGICHGLFTDILRTQNLPIDLKIKINMVLSDLPRYDDDVLS